MRIERSGPVAALTPRLERFFIEALGGEALDKLQRPEERRADYKCLRGLLAIELKTLEVDGTERVGNLISVLSERPDWPTFYGSVPINSMLKNIADSEKVKALFVERIGRAVKDHVRKANKQLAAHAAAFPRKNLVKLMVLANEDHEIYEPELVAYLSNKLLNRQEKGAFLYPNIDAIIFISERHATPVQDQIAFPIVGIEGPSFRNEQWKEEVIKTFMRRWAHWNGVPLHHADVRPGRFRAVEHIPERMKRHELWRLEYRRRPYMSRFTKEQLRDRFDEVMCISSLSLLKDSPLKPSREELTSSMSTWSHLMLEMGWRGIPVTEFKHAPKRLVAAAKRLNMPREVLAWFESDMSRTRK